MGNEAALNDFNKWVDERKLYYAVEAVERAEDFASVKGARYLLGELEVIRAMVNWLPEEAQRKKEQNDV